MKRLMRPVILVAAAIGAVGCGGGTPADVSDANAQVFTGVLTQLEYGRAYRLEVTQSGTLQAVLTWQEAAATLVIDLYEVDFHAEGGVEYRPVATSNLQGAASRVELSASVVPRQYQLQILHGRNVSPTYREEPACRTCDATFRLAVTGPVGSIRQW